MDTTSALVGILEKVVLHFGQIDGHIEKIASRLKAQDEKIHRLQEQADRFEKNMFIKPSKSIAAKAKSMAEDCIDLDVSMRILTGRRDAMIKMMAKHGMSIREIAQVAGVSKTQIHRLASEHMDSAPPTKKSKAAPHGR